mgnify:CR=1 FL=1
MIFLCTVEVSRNRLTDWITDQNLSALPSSPRCTNYKPLFSSLSVENSVLSVGNSSRVWLSNCLLEIITWPMKESKFQEFQETWSMKQEKDQAWIRKWQSKDNKRKGLETLVILYQPCSHRLSHKGCFSCFTAVRCCMIQPLFIILVIQE